MKKTSLTLVLLLFTSVFSGCEKNQSDKNPEENLVQNEAKNLPPNLIPNGTPDFNQIQAISKIGKGVAASFLKINGRGFTGTADNNDSLYIDSSTMTQSEVKEAIKNALNQDKHIIVDGEDSKESSINAGKIMLDSLGISSLGVTVYAISKGPEGKVFVTPLQSIVNEKGVRQINQLENYLTSIQN